MLQRHPDTYSDEELEHWVRHLVDNQIEEGPRLDYKESVDLDKPKQRREVTKDISSFANEVGGVVIYGIPEERTGQHTAIPKKPYGIHPIAGIESQLENIWVESIRPTLPEWRIRRVDLTEYPGKVVYVAWTPESWLKPHMVEAYEDRRYYRRGQLRAVEMAEHEVRLAYETRAALRDRLETFLDSPELTYILDRTGIQQVANLSLSNADRGGFISQYILCPAAVAAERVEFGSVDMRNWLNVNPYPPSDWEPSPYGVRTRAKVDYGNSTWEPITEIHKNGALSHWRPSNVRHSFSDQQANLDYIAEFRQVLFFLQFGQRLFGKIGYWGPLRLRIIIDSAGLIRLYLTLSARDIGHGSKLLLSHQKGLRAEIEVAAPVLMQNPNRVLKDIADRIFESFGVWEADCFDANYNLIR